MVQIRKMTSEDYDQVFALWRSTPGMGLNTVDDSREGIAFYLRRNPETCFVAEAEGRIIGVILTGHDGRRGYIHHTAVHPSFRHQGVASSLVEKAMAALEREGIHRVALVAFADNASGNAFWEAQGFTQREDLVYRNRSIHQLERIPTGTEE